MGTGSDREIWYIAWLLRKKRGELAAAHPKSRLALFVPRALPEGLAHDSASARLRPRVNIREAPSELRLL